MLGEVVTPHEALLTLGTLKALVPWEEEIAVTKEGIQCHCPSLRKEKPQNVRAPGKANLALSLHSANIPSCGLWTHLSAPAAQSNLPHSSPFVSPCPGCLSLRLCIPASFWTVSHGL